MSAAQPPLPATPALHLLHAGGGGAPRWHTVDFISDLHLKPEEPLTAQAWQRYLQHTPAQAIFMLGDLFEAWVGDDCASAGSFEADCAQALRNASARAQLFFMHGNRDFLLGQSFAASAGITLLPDPTVLRLPSPGRDSHLADTCCLLTHGDALCLDDAPYQQFRQQVRQPAWQSAFLARPLPERQAIARHMRAHSQAAQTPSSGSETYADIHPDLARQWLRDARASVLIHGHTHRPGDHLLGHDPQGRPLHQIVLSDWHIDTHTRRLQVLRWQRGQFRRLAPESGQAA